MPDREFLEEISKHKDMDILRAALLFSKAIAYPEIEVADYVQKINQIAHHAGRYVASQGSIPEKADALSDYLFTTAGFRGNAQNYYDPDNSFLNAVLDTKRGIPITLSLLYASAARTLGIPAYLVGLPGHVIVGIEGEINTLIDPFHGGQRLSLDDCETLVLQTTGYQGKFNPGWLRPSENVSILLRMLNNLKGIYLNMENWEQALKVVEHIQALQPGLVSLYRDLGLLHHRSGHPQAAIYHLSTYLVNNPDDSESEKLNTLLQQLIQQYARRN